MNAHTPPSATESTSPDAQTPDSAKSLATVPPEPGTGLAPTSSGDLPVEAPEPSDDDGEEWDEGEPEPGGAEAAGETPKMGRARRRRRVPRPDSPEMRLR